MFSGIATAAMMEKRKRGRPPKVRPMQVPPTPANSPKTPEDVPKVLKQLGKEMDAGVDIGGKEAMPKKVPTQEKDVGVDIGGKEEMPKKVLSKEEAKEMLRDKLDKLIESKKKESEKPGSVFMREVVMILLPYALFRISA